MTAPPAPPVALGWRYQVACLLFFCMLFGPKLLVSNLDLLSIACVVALLAYGRHSLGVLDDVGFWLTILAMVYVELVLAVAGVADWWWIFKPPRVLLNLLAVYATVTYCLYHFGRAATLRMFHNAVFVHALIMIGMALVPSFSNLMTSVFGGATRTMQVTGLTRGLALTAIVMMFPFVSFPVFALKWGYRERFIAIKLLAILWATLYSGRTGFYLCLGMSAVMTGALMFRSVRSMRRAVVYLGALALALAGLVQFLLNPAESVLGRIPGLNKVTPAISHSFEPVVNYLKGAGFTSRSTDHILSMPIVYHNRTPFEFVFGTGLYGRGDPMTHLPTDYAYLHMLSAFGFLGIGLFLLAYIGPGLQAWRLHASPVYWAWFAIATITIVANVKETALFTRNIYTVQIMFLAWLGYERQQRRAAVQKRSEA